MKCAHHGLVAAFIKSGTHYNNKNELRVGSSILPVRTRRFGLIVYLDTVNALKYMILLKIFI